MITSGQSRSHHRILYLFRASHWILLCDWDEKALSGVSRKTGTQKRNFRNAFLTLKNVAVLSSRYLHELLRVCKCRKEIIY